MRKEFLSLIACSAAVLSGTPPALATVYRDITITAESVMAGNPTHGYTEYLVNITNSSVDKSHQVTLMLPRGHHGGIGNHFREIRRTVTVGPGAMVRVSLLQHALPLGGSDIGVDIDGRSEEQTVPIT